jgi:alpha-1,2-mannosyltransferase
MNFGRKVGNTTLWFLAASSGMFIASTAFLPSTTAMFGATLAFAYWIRRSYERAVFWMAFSALFAWPFSIVIGIPMALDVIYRWFEFLD